LRTAILKTEPVESLELVVGRAMAACAHPFAAWRVLSPSGRMIIVTAYFAAAYITILAGLIILSPASLPLAGY